MTLRDALPLETIMARYPEAREVVLADTVASLRRNLLDRIPAVGLFVWDEMAYRGDTKKPEKMQKSIRTAQSACSHSSSRSLAVCQFPMPIMPSGSMA